MVVNDYYQTTDPKIFAIGDLVSPGLLTDAIGAGRKAAAAIADILDGKITASALARLSPLEEEPVLFESRLSEFVDLPPVIERARVSLEYLDPRVCSFSGVDECGISCSSCGACRDCGICVEICPQAAITRKAIGHERWEYVVDPERCIGCGFCAGACPCGIWALVPNEAL